VETQAISKYGNFSKIIANSKCEELNPKQAQIIEIQNPKEIVSNI
jgi:hypothetical protein